jgi:hypothetical protein
MQVHAQDTNLIGIGSPSGQDGGEVVTLVQAVGASRASLARRFADAVGEPTITYSERTPIDLAAGVPCAPGPQSWRRRQHAG